MIFKILIHEKFRRSDNIKRTPYNDANEFVDEHFESLHITSLKYNLKVISYLSKRDDWKTLNNSTIDLNILYIKKKKYV